MKVVAHIRPNAVKQCNPTKFHNTNCAVIQHKNYNINNYQTLKLSRYSIVQRLTGRNSNTRNAFQKKVLDEAMRNTAHLSVIFTPCQAQDFYFFQLRIFQRTAKANIELCCTAAVGLHAIASVDNGWPDTIIDTAAMFGRRHSQNMNIGLNRRKPSNAGNNRHWPIVHYLHVVTINRLGFSNLLSTVARRISRRGNNI